MVLWDRDTANETSLRGFMALNTIKLICGFGSRLPVVFAKVSSESTDRERAVSAVPGGAALVGKPSQRESTTTSP